MANKAISATSEPDNPFKDVEVTSLPSPVRRAVLGPNEVTAKFFDRAVAAAVVVHGRGFPVSLDELRAVDPLLGVEELASLVRTENWRFALADRGIPDGAIASGLSAEQLFALQVVSDPSNPMPILKRLKVLSIPQVKWRGWLRQPEFAAEYSRLQGVIVAESVVPSLTALQVKAASGDVGAIKLLLEISGNYVPGGQPSQDRSQQYERVIQEMVELVQRHVRDPEALAALGAGFRDAASGLSEAPSSLPTEPVEDAIIVSDEVSPSVEPVESSEEVDSELSADA